MQDIIKIRCPFCSAVMAVKNKPGLEKLNVPCPVCKKSTPFVQYQVLGENPFQSNQNNDDCTHGLFNEDETQIGGKKTTQIGLLRQTAPQKRIFQLKPGINVVGRASSMSSATISIDTGESRRMSREHLAIEVKTVPGQGYVYYARLCKEKVNRTLINNKPLDYADCVLLENNTIISLPVATFCFEIPDPESTTIN